MNPETPVTQDPETMDPTPPWITELQERIAYLENRVEYLETRFEGMQDQVLHHDFVLQDCCNR